MFTFVTHTSAQSDVRGVITHLETVASQTISPHWNPGRPGRSEPALLDAVFSSRAPYGGARTGVRRVVDAWSDYRQVDIPDDLTKLAEFVDVPEALEQILGHRGRVPGNALTKAAAVATAAQRLTALGVYGSADVNGSTLQRTEFVAIPGLGDITWECFLFQLGIRTEAAIRHLHTFVQRALTSTTTPAAGQEPSAPDPIDDAYAADLLVRTAGHLGVDLAALEHAVWRFQHRGPKRVRAEARTPIDESA